MTDTQTTESIRTVLLIVAVELDADDDRTPEQVRDEIQRDLPFAIVDLPA